MGLVPALDCVLRGRIARPIVAHALVGAWSIALAVVMVSRTMRGAGTGAPTDRGPAGMKEILDKM
jgi:hypothetical protein